MKTKWPNITSCFIGMLLICRVTHANPPEDYYEPADGLTGGELKQALNQIIRRDHRNGQPQHAVIPYNNLLPPLRELWRDPENASNIRLIYSSDPAAAMGSTWNREHLWPRSRGNADQLGPDDSDLFHVVPADGQLNSLRSSRYFDLSDPRDPGYVIPALPSALQDSYDSNSWQPPPDERGDIARALFYMDVRYNGSELYTTDLELVSFPPAGPQMGNLNTLLLWHAEDPPDDVEREFNSLIYSNYQGNRNPFIDHPEYVTAIWGTGIPGDPLNVPLARVEAAVATASELPSSSARFVVSLNQFASPEDVVINFSMSGTTDVSEYSLTGDDVFYDATAGTGTVVVKKDFATAVIILTPVADGITEGSETAALNLESGNGYSTTPDASRIAAVTLRDTPSLPAYWSFNNVTTTGRFYMASEGVGYVSLSNWTGNVSSFSGSSGSSLALVGSAGNNSWIDFSFSMTGYRDLSLSFFTRGTSSGFTSGYWSFSTNGVDFVTNTAVNTATTSTTFSERRVDFSMFSWLNNAESVTMRYTLYGATSNTGNNRIDELRFNASPMATGDELREASVVASINTGTESPAASAVFSVRLNGLAPEGGLVVAFHLSGTAGPDDYTVNGAQTWDPSTRIGTIFFPENNDTIFISILPLDDGIAEPAETVIFTLTAPSESAYLLGANTTATVAIRDRTSNDNFVDAFVLAGLPVSATGDNIDASRETGEPQHFGTQVSRSVWWRWTAPSNAIISISTGGSNFDTILAVYAGSSIGSLTRLGSDDDSAGNLASRILMSVTAGTTYMIAVDGYGSAVGTINLSISASVTPIIASFLPLAGVPGTSVTINGLNFSDVTSVAFGGVPAASFDVVNDTEIRATVPEAATSSIIRVVSSSGVGQSANRFNVAVRPGIPFVSSDRMSIDDLFTTQGTTSSSSTFTVSANCLPGPLEVSVPDGFEVSLDGINYTNTLNIIAPDRYDHALNYANEWFSGLNGGFGFEPWILYAESGSGSAGTTIENPAVAGVSNFSEQAFCVYAIGTNTGSEAWAWRPLSSPLSVGEKMSFRWGLNLDSNNSAGYFQVYVSSGDAFLFGVYQAGYPGRIYFYDSSSMVIDTGIDYGAEPMNWSMTLINQSMLRISATGRDGDTNQVVFTRDINVSGAPDMIGWGANEIDNDIRRRAYFNDLRIHSAFTGGGHLPPQTIFVRLDANAPIGASGGDVLMSSGGQALTSVSVTGTVTATNEFSAWAASYGLNPASNGAPEADTDDDGHTNLQEFWFGGNPLAKDGSLIQLTNTGSEIVIHFLIREEGSYRIMGKRRLSDEEWNHQTSMSVRSDHQHDAPGGYRRVEVVITKEEQTGFYFLETLVP